ncbi:hypothetical protein GH714_028803 [Hevea brasiliensis]|uniref:ORC5 lid domain-containing protein n=1 Tax=Hevea brasiliensis TaxID=3981 RepID=A0A6A6MIB7_HEVBR|nr:hypothetical protein GH714_028803 [Hevea brasiliensis]
MLPIFIYGGASTGKTTIILQIFRHLNRPFVYASYRTCYSPCLFFESILNQLLLYKKNAVNGYSSSKRCEKPSHFVNFLHESLLSVINDLKVNTRKLSSNKLAGQPNGSMVYLILDNLELVRDWDKSSTILPFMFNLYDILKMPEVGLIYISNTSPDTYYSNVGYVEPIPVYFPEYTEEDLRQIFLRNQANQKLYSSFLDVVLKPFCRVTRRVDDLSTTFSSLFRKYCEPLNDLEHVPNEEMKRRASVKSMEQKEAAEQELLVKGPGTFPLESLCNANFIIKGGSCPLEGSTRYRSTITEDMALKVVCCWRRSLWHLPAVDMFLMDYCLGFASLWGGEKGLLSSMDKVLRG